MPNSLNLHPYNLANRLADKLHEIIVELEQGALYQPFIVDGQYLIDQQVRVPLNTFSRLDPYPQRKWGLMGILRLRFSKATP